MRNFIAIFLCFVLFFLLSCKSSDVNNVPDSLPKVEDNSSTNNPNLVTNNTNQKVQVDSPSYNEFPAKWPYLYSDFLTALKKNNFKTVLMSKFPEFDLSIQTSGFRWIERAVINRRDEFITSVIKTTTYNFAKILVSHKIRPLYKENMIKIIENSKNINEGNIADAMLHLTGKVTVTALYPLAETGFQYVLQLKYETNAYLVDIANGARCWVGDATWRRNTIVNEAQAD